MEGEESSGWQGKLSKGVDLARNNLNLVHREIWTIHCTTDLVSLEARCVSIFAPLLISY